MSNLHGILLITFLKLRNSHKVFYTWISFHLSQNRELLTFLFSCIGSANNIALEDQRLVLQPSNIYDKLCYTVQLWPLKKELL